jgi:hypothetical protein
MAYKSGKIILKDRMKGTKRSTMLKDMISLLETDLSKREKGEENEQE